MPHMTMQFNERTTELVEGKCPTCEGDVDRWDGRRRGMFCCPACEAIEQMRGKSYVFDEQSPNGREVSEV